MGSNRTVSPIEVSRQLLTGLASAQTATVDHLISSDAFMQIWFGNVNQTYNSRPQVCRGLVEQTNSWPNKLFFNVQAWDDDDDSVNVQFDIWDRPNGRVLHSNCCLSITLHKDKIKSIKLYQGRLFDA
jgi:hypothetical protein